MKNDIPFFIVNPTSGGGQGKKLWLNLLSQIPFLLGRFEWAFTQKQGDGKRQTEEALKSGHRWIIAAGGDGTLNEVVNGVLNVRDARENSKVGIFSLGTGDDFVKTLNPRSSQDKDPIQALKRLKNHKVRKMDVGQVRFRDSSKKEAERYFINIADFGLGGQVIQEVNRSTKILGSKLTYLFAGLKNLIGFKPVSVNIETPERNYFFDEVVMGLVANGRYFGSGLCMAPEAQIDDGLFDILIIQRENLLSILPKLPKIYRAENFEDKNFIRFRTSKLTVHRLSKNPIFLDVDGEQPGELPATFEVLPKALNVCI